VRQNFRKSRRQNFRNPQEKELVFSPSDERLAREMGIPRWKIERLRGWIHQQTLSLSMPITEDENLTLEDVVTKRNHFEGPDSLAVEALTAVVERELAHLHPRLALVVKLRFGFEPRGPMTQLQVATQMGLSVRRVRQMQRKAFRLLYRSRALKAWSATGRYGPV
jgi:DNA-directed RNA polymerase sigma subunit (sigma70/sigma32)